MSQTSIIAAALVIAFVIFVTVRGELPIYFGVLGIGPMPISGAAAGGTKVSGAGFVGGGGGAFDVDIGGGGGGVHIGAGGIGVDIPLWARGGDLWGNPSVGSSPWGWGGFGGGGGGVFGGGGNLLID